MPGLGGIMKAAATSVGAATRGIRLPNYDKVRDVMDAQLDAVWTGQKPPKLGLDDAVRLGDIAMKGTTASSKEAVKKRAVVKKAAKP